MLLDRIWDPYFQVAGGATLIENRSAHLEGAEGDFDPPVLLLVATASRRSVGQAEEARAGPEAMLETHPRPQGHVAT